MIKDALLTFLRWIRLSLTKRWTIFILLTLVVALSILFLQPESLTGTSSKSIFIVGLFNFNLLLLIALGFAVGRNLIKLFLDRRNKILGSKLRQKLVTAFLLLTLLPTLIMFFLATGLISRATSGWFNAQVASVVSNALFISQTYINQEEQNLLEDSKQVTSIVKNSVTLLTELESTKELFAELRNKQQLFSLGLYAPDGQELISDRSIVNEIGDEESNNKDTFRRCASKAFWLEEKD
jgi:two-component system, NtrC family, nitrogen regulation sensor histidine kinase NtrY